MAEPLPTLTEESSLRTLLIHTRAGNVLGFAVYFSEEDVGMARTVRVDDKAGLGKCILGVYNKINDGVEDQDIELGTDLFFRHQDEDGTVPDATLISLKPADIDYLLECLPSIILDTQASSQH